MCNNTNIKKVAKYTFSLIIPAGQLLSNAMITCTWTVFDIPTGLWTIIFHDPGFHNSFCFLCCHLVWVCGMVTEIYWWLWDFCSCLCFVYVCVSGWSIVFLIQSCSIRV